MEIKPISPIFNGSITLTNTETGNHRTFSIRTQDKDAKFAPGSRILALLSGPDNNQDYKPFAFVNDDGSINVWKKYQGKKKSIYSEEPATPTSYELFADMIRVLLGGFESKYNKRNWNMMELLFEGKCIMCNRKLTTPESIKRGIGPICEGR